MGYLNILGLLAWWGSAVNSTQTSAQGGVVSFGPFRLFPNARTFEKDGVPLALGNRAFDILSVLVEHAGEVVSHRELMARAWRGLVVDPSNLRVHITGLRKALGDADGKDRYISNVTGQGYCFVAPIQYESDSCPPRLPQYPCGAARQRLILPPMLARMIGRDDKVRTIAADLIADRFVTIIGPGGMGKTTVAVCIAHSMLEEFADAVCFVDIGAIKDPNLVATTIASALGLTIQTESVVPALMLCLRTLRILLVLDNCEHVIEASAALAERIFQEAPGVHILATSREALRVEGEHAFWLPPLDSPPESGVSAAEAMKFPAVQLFMERAAAGGSRFELSDADAPTLAGICGRLDGIPLAIEFAAARIGAHGIAGTASLLKDRFGLHWQGRRTAVPRHQTLHALLDWSHGLLMERERIVLRRLSIFVGAFTLEAAAVITCDSAADQPQVIDAIDGLVAKSLLSVIPAGSATRYRLLETTRVYALEKLAESGEQGAIAYRHARHFASILNRDGPALSERLGNLRAALEWAFGGGEGSSKVRDPVLAIDLASGSVPIFLELSLLTECHKWSSRALAVLDDTTRASVQEMVLQEGRAISSMWTMGNSDDARVAITRALQIAQNLSDTSHRLRLLAGMQMFLMRAGELKKSLAVAEEFARTAQGADDSYGAIADCLLGCSYLFLGNQEAAKRHLEKVLSWPGSSELQLFGLDYRLRALVALSLVYWIMGFPDRATATAHEAVREAERTSKPLNVCFAWLYTSQVFLWCQELGAAREVLEKLMAHPNWHALPSLHATAFALQGELLVRQGENDRGVVMLRSALSAMRSDHQTLLLARASCALAQGLMDVGQLKEALAVVENAIADESEGGERSQYPELLRIQADILASMPKPDKSRIQGILTRARDEARRQNASTWELRVVNSSRRL